MMRIRIQHAKIPAALGAALLLLVVGCASTPDTRPEQQALQSRAQATLQEMLSRDPSLQQVLDQTYAYVVFPSVGEGGFIVGAGQGVGVVYERGLPIGSARLTEASIGAQIGGQTFSELILLRTPQALARLQSNQFDLRADLNAVALRAGIAAATHFEDDIAVFVVPEFGLMAEASVGGQRISYEPLV